MWYDAELVATGGSEGASPSCSAVYIPDGETQPAHAYTICFPFQFRILPGIMYFVINKVCVFKLVEVIL